MYTSDLLPTLWELCQPSVHLPPGIPDTDCLTGVAVEGQRPLPLAVALVLYGAKPLALLHGDEASLTLTLRQSERLGLVGLLSGFEYRPVFDSAKNDYSNITGPRFPARPGTGCWRALLIGWDPVTVCRGWEALHLMQDAELGRLLGYPACCVHAFTEDWPRAATEFAGDPWMMKIAQSSVPPIADWQLNLFARYYGKELIQHFPCEFGCEASRRIASLHWQTLQQFDPDYLQGFADIMRGVVITGPDQQICLLPGAAPLGEAVQNWTINYAPHRIPGRIGSRLGQLIADHHTLTYHPTTHQLTVGQHSIAAHLAVFQ